jgi:hypothetical protein
MAMAAGCAADRRAAYYRFVLENLQQREKPSALVATALQILGGELGAAQAKSTEDRLSPGPRNTTSLLNSSIRTGTIGEDLRSLQSNTQRSMSTREKLSPAPHPDE